LLHLTGQTERFSADPNSPQFAEPRCADSCASARSSRKQGCLGCVLVVDVLDRLLVCLHRGDLAAQEGIQLIDTPVHRNGCDGFSSACDAATSGPENRVIAQSIPSV
jgi:hypothetical protein